MFIKSLKASLGYGLLVWVIPFALAFILFPIRNSDRIFFESIMPVALVATVAVLARIARNKEFLRSWQTGLLWLAMSVVLDQAFFTWGPQKISFTDYWKDIGFVYLVIPVITWAVYYSISKSSTIAAHEVGNDTHNANASSHFEVPRVSDDKLSQ